MQTTSHPLATIRPHPTASIQTPRQLSDHKLQRQRGRQKVSRLTAKINAQCAVLSEARNVVGTLEQLLRGTIAKHENAVARLVALKAAQHD